MNLTDHLRGRIDECRILLQKATDAQEQAMRDCDMYRADLAGYERALNAEQRREGTAPMPVSVLQTDLPLEGNPDDAINKAEFTRKFIRSRAEVGATPNDIMLGFQEARIPIKKPYIYALVQRLQKQTAIRQRRGKWYPVPESEQSVNGTAEKTLP